MGDSRMKDLVFYYELALEPDFTVVDGILVPRGYEICPECEGSGMFMALYPNGPTEVYCEECYGEGVVPK